MSFDPYERVRLGGSDVEITRLGFQVAVRHWSFDVVDENSIDACPRIDITVRYVKP